MNLLTFIFSLLQAVANVSPDEINSMRTDATTWYNKIPYKPIGDEEFKPKSLLQKGKQINEFWGFKLFMSFLLVPSISFFTSLSNGSLFSEEEHEEEEHPISEYEEFLNFLDFKNQSRQQSTWKY